MSSFSPSVPSRVPTEGHKDYLPGLGGIYGNQPLLSRRRRRAARRRSRRRRPATADQQLNKSPSAPQKELDAVSKDLIDLVDVLSRQREERVEKNASTWNRSNSSLGSPSKAAAAAPASEKKREEGEEDEDDDDEEDAVAVVQEWVAAEEDAAAARRRSVLKIGNTADIAQGKIFAAAAAAAAAAMDKAEAEADAAATEEKGSEETKEEKEKRNARAEAVNTIYDVQFVNGVNKLEKINFELLDMLETAKNSDEITENYSQQKAKEEIETITNELNNAADVNQELKTKNTELFYTLQQTNMQVVAAAAAIEAKNLAIEAKNLAERNRRKVEAAAAAALERNRMMEESKRRGELKVEVFRAKKELTKVQKKLDEINKEAEEKVSDLKEKLKIKYQELEVAEEVAEEVKEELNELKEYFNENLEEKIRDNIILAEFARLKAAPSLEDDELGGVDPKVKNCIEILSTKLIKNNPLIRMALDKFMGLEAQRSGGKKRKTKKRKGGRKTKKRKGGRKSKKMGGRKSKRKGNRKTRK